MIARVAFAASMESMDPSLRGALLLVQKGQITLVATDGYRLAYVSQKTAVAPAGGARPWTGFLVALVVISGGDWLLGRDANLKIGMFSSYQDAVVASVVGMTGAENQQLLLETTNTFHQRYPATFKRYFIKGDSHCIGDYYWKVNGVTVWSWIDALVNASMLLGGMGPVESPQTPGETVFAGLYALYASMVFLVVAGIILAPVVHRVLHEFHWDEEPTVHDDARPAGSRSHRRRPSE